MSVTNKHVTTESFGINATSNRSERTLIYNYLGVIADEKLTWKGHSKRCWAWEILSTPLPLVTVFSKLNDRLESELLQTLLTFDFHCNISK